MERTRGAHIKNENTVVAYLAVRFTIAEENGSRLEKRKVDRIEILKAPHRSTKNTLEPFENSALQGFPVKMSDCCNLTMHPAAASYMEDFPKGEDQIEVRKRVSLALLCSRCLTQKQDWASRKPAHVVLFIRIWWCLNFWKMEFNWVPLKNLNDSPYWH